jgi:hypothetical protein
MDMHKADITGRLLSEAKHQSVSAYYMFSELVYIMQLQDSAHISTPSHSLTAMRPIIRWQEFRV